MDKINQLEKLRKNIDIIDQKLIIVLAERFKKTEEIMSFKKKNGLPIKDKNREKVILKGINKMARKLKMSKKFITDIFKKILKESKRR